MKQRFLYIFLLMLFAKVGMGQVVSFSGATNNFEYNGVQQTPFPTTANGCLYTKIEYTFTGISVSYGPIIDIPPTSSGSYTVNAKLIGTGCGGATSGDFPFTIRKKDITGSFTADYKQYDGNNSATVLTRLPGAIVIGDAVTLTGGTATFNDASVANGKTVTLVGAILSGSNAGNYNLLNVSSTTANITKKDITGSFTADNKQYDGNNSATVLTRLPGAILAGEAVTLSGGSATFNDASVANGKTVTLVGAILSGSNAGNYNLLNVSSTTANITKKDITITVTPGQTKVYGAADPTSYVYTLNAPLLGSDVLTGELTRVSGETVGLYAINQGTLTNTNYDITYVGNNFTITKKPITVTVNPNQTKVYGAVNPVTYTYGVSPSLTGLADLNGTLTRASGETVGPWAIQQNDLTTANNPNYTINYIGSDFTITQKPLTITATPGQTKVYGATDPTSYAYSLNTPLVGSDVLTGGLTRESGESVGSYAINQGSLSNANYDITYLGSNFTITKAPLSITGITGANKIYDGTTNVTINGTASYVGLVASDAGLAVTGTPSFNFNNKNVGNSKPITVTGFTAPSPNYTLTQPTDLAGSITPKTASINIVANNKEYDGTTTATLNNISSPSFIAGDIVNINYTAAVFDTKDPGTNKTVTVTGINLGGVDAFNYNLTNTTATAIANITGAITSSIRPFVLPNAFTPNGDTKNTEFKFIVNDPSKITLRLFQIYNRNGKLMFSTNDISKGWDGRYNGVIQDMGVYFVKYRIDINGASPSVDTVPFYLLK